MKKVLVVIAGVMISGLISGIFEMGIAHQVYPTPADLDLTNKEMMGEYVAGLPIGALLLVVAGWLLGPLVGSFVAAKIMPENWRKSAIAIGVAISLFVVLNLMSFFHPTWMWVIGILMPLPMAYLGGMLAVGKRKEA